MLHGFRKIFTSFAIALSSVLLGYLLSQSQLIERWENQSRDVIFRDFQKPHDLDEVVIIAIDQNSLDHFQTNAKILWPWPRDLYAATLEYLQHCGAKVIAFDIILSSPDIDRLNMQAEHADSMFAFQIRKNGNVVLAAQMEDSSHSGSGEPFRNYSHPIEFNVPHDIVKEYPSATLPIYRFQKAMAFPGTVNFFTDDDGVCRNLQMLFKYKDITYPYMALTAALLYEDAHKIGFDHKSNALVLNDHRIPLRKNGRFEVFWYGAGGPGNTFHYVSIGQVINSYMQWKTGRTPEIPPEIFNGKTIFIGATAAGLLDLKTTPFSPLEPYPGVEIYASVFSNIIHDDYIRDFPIGGWLLISAVFLFLLAMVWQNFRIWKSGLLSIFFFALPLVTAVLSFQTRQLFIPLVFSEIAIVLTIILVLFVNFLTEGREKRLVKKVFNRYLHPAVVETLTENPEKVEMGGKEIEATVLFTDLQGFTGISEHFTAPEIVQFLNNYFEKVEQIIFDNSGMLDKYTGDGIMAIFGAPIETGEHAHRTCHAALDFKKLSALKIEAKNMSIPLVTRVGINSGLFVVGNIGSSNRMDFTAIGDTVNLSARLEGVNKIYGTQNIISESTFAFVEDDFVCRELDFIRVKGRAKPLRIYTVVNTTGLISDTEQSFLERHHEALSLYRDKRYEKAHSAFEELQKINPKDPVSKVFIERCTQLLISPELVDENGIFNITQK